MPTYCVKVTWLRNDQDSQASCIGNDAFEVLVADDEESACKEAIEDHENRYDDDCDEHHPEAEIEEWCVSGRADSSEPWETMADGFRSQEEAISSLKSQHIEWFRDSAREFYIDWNSHDEPADLFAETDGDSLWFLSAEGRVIDI